MERDTGFLTMLTGQTLTIHSLLGKNMAKGHSSMVGSESTPGSPILALKMAAIVQHVPSLRKIGAPLANL